MYTAAEKLLLERVSQGIDEAEIQRIAKLLAERYDWLYYHVPDSRLTPPGFPDVVMVKNGVLVLAELKAKSTRVRCQQREWLTQLGAVIEGRRLRSWGEPKTYAGLVTPDNFEEFLRLVKCSTLQVEQQ